MVPTYAGRTMVMKMFTSNEEEVNMMPTSAWRMLVLKILVNTEEKVMIVPTFTKGR